MANRRLERAGVERVVCERLSEINVTTVRDLLSMSSIQLMLQANMGLKEADELIAAVSEKVCPKPRNVLELLLDRSKENMFLGCGVNQMDLALKGGLPIGSISEICGTPGVGKTQFCLSCTLHAVAIPSDPVLSSFSQQNQRPTVIYIDTELKFDPTRLVQMAVECFPEQYSSDYRIDAPHQLDKLLEAIDVKRPVTMNELKEELSKLQMAVLSRNVVLIVIDSIAALARKEGFNETDKERFFLTQAGELKKLAETCRCVVLATNQVSPTSSASATGGFAARNPMDLYGDAIHDEWGTYQPTLGPTWHHCVSTRLTMHSISRDYPHQQPPQQGQEYETGQEDHCQQLRCLSITKSPIAAPYKLEVIICARGIVAQ